MGYQAFVRRGRKQQFAYVGVLQMECDKGQCEVGMQLNFTHRATLGGGDDADES